MTPVASFVRTLAASLLALAGALGIVSGCVDAVGWSVETFGAQAVSMAGMFILGWVVCLAAVRTRR